MSLRKGSRKRKQEKWHRKESLQSKKVVSLTKTFLCTFFCSSIFIPYWFLIKLWKYYSNKKNTPKKKPTSISEITSYIIFAQKYYNSTTLSMWVVYTHMLSKNSIASKDLIFYLLWYNVIRWSRTSHICKISYFLSFYSFLVKFRE